MKTRTFFFVVLCSAIWMGRMAYESYIEPPVSTSLSVRALNGGDAEASALRASNQVLNHVDVEFTGLILIAAGICFGSVLCRASGSRGK